MRRNKYNNKKVIHDGIAFDSKKEGARYCELKLLERAGEIQDLVLQPVFPLEISNSPILIKSKGYPNGRKAKYTADFKYYDTRKQQTVVEDVKGFKTQEYKLRKAVFEAIYRIDILET